MIIVLSATRFFFCLVMAWRVRNWFLCPSRRFSQLRVDGIWHLGSGRWRLYL